MLKFDSTDSTDGKDVNLARNIPLEQVGGKIGGFF